MIKLHLGCGHRNFGADWIHIDGNYYDHVQYHDIIDLPCDKECVDLIYASHVIQYFDRQEIQDVLRKWYNVLKVGGILRLAVPDFYNMVFWYVNSLNDNFKLDNLLGPLYGKMKMNQQTIYHKTCYDFDSLEQVLTSIGFQNIRKYDWRKTSHAQFDDHSQAYIPHMDKANGKLISLNVECNK